jgi:hypothetical protein
VEYGVKNRQRLYESKSDYRAVGFEIIAKHFPSLSQKIHKFLFLAAGIIEISLVLAKDMSFVKKEVASIVKTITKSIYGTDATRFKSIQWPCLLLKLWRWIIL